MTGLEIGLALGAGAGVGLVVGLLGAGGSILSVPTLILLLGMGATRATGTSLIVVSIVSSAGVLTHALAGRVVWRAGIGFAATGVPAAIAGGFLAALLSDEVLTAALVVLLVGTSVWMWNRDDRVPEGPRPPTRWLRILPAGLAVGLLTGTLGVGGGFVVVPALAALLGLPMPLAIGTSQLVLVINALAGLTGRVGSGSVVLPVGLVFAAGGVLGTVVASRLVGRLGHRTLSRLFAWLLVLVAVGLTVDLLLAVN